MPNYATTHPRPKRVHCILNAAQKLRRCLCASVPLVLVSSLSLAGQTPKRVNESSRTADKSERKKTGETNEADNDREKALSPEVLTLLTQARMAPPEFRADALIRLARSPLVSDAKLKAQLLDEAFDSAAGARFPVKKNTFSGLDMDTRAGILWHAYNLNLDGFSLRSRVIESLLSSDRGKARELFSRIPIKNSIGDPLSCKDVLVYDLTTYYDTAAHVAASGFNQKEIEAGERTFFIEDIVQTIISPAQLGPVAKLLATAPVSATDTDRFAHLYSVKLRQAPTDDYRTLYSSIAGYRVNDSVYLLRKLLTQHNLPARELTEAYRDLVVRMLSGRSCADIPGDKTQLPFFVKQANSSILAEQKITADDVRPDVVDSGYEEYPYWTSPIAIRALDETRQLRFDRNGNELTSSAKQSLAWRDTFKSLYALLDEWKEQDEKTAEDYLHQKAIIYTSLVELAPTAEIREDVLRQYLFFLRNMSSDRINQVEWFVHVKEVIDIARTQEKVKAGVFSALSNSKIPVMELYTSLAAHGLLEKE